MARPVEFDREDVLLKAMMEFWRRGYTATSIKHLTDVTQLQPGSLYGAFRSKRELFLHALDNYFETLRVHIRTILNSEDPPLLRIRHFFQELLRENSRDPDRKGCLLVNTLLETSTSDKEINQRVTKMFREVEGEFRQVLEAAAVDGTLDARKQPAILAKVLVTGIFGLRVYNKTNPSNSELRRIADGLLSVLE